MMNVFQRISQLISTLLYNPYLFGFYSGSIYLGKLKVIPCPGLNCHSCPSAVFACPIGAIQQFVSYGPHHISFYVFGFLGAVGTVGGRIVCGWACPFGFMQDLLFKIRSLKLEIPPILYKCKYLVLFLLVFAVAYYTKEPWFCKLCPAGTLEAGIPLILLNIELRELIDGLFFVKAAILILFLAWMIISKRPFCRTVCPLGAIYSFFNKISMFRMEVDKGKCIKCDLCLKECPVSLKIYEEGADSANCIRCFRCSKCPTDAVNIIFNSKLGKLRN